MLTNTNYSRFCHAMVLWPSGLRRQGKVTLPYIPGLFGGTSSNLVGIISFLASVSSEFGTQSCELDPTEYTGPDPHKFPYLSFQGRTVCSKQNAQQKRFFEPVRYNITFPISIPFTRFLRQQADNCCILERI